MNKADKKAFRSFMILVGICAVVLALMCYDSYGATNVSRTIGTVDPVDSLVVIVNKNGAFADSILMLAADSADADSNVWEFTISLDETKTNHIEVLVYYTGESGPASEAFVWGPTTAILTGSGTNNYVYWAIDVTNNDTLSSVDLTARDLTASWEGGITTSSSGNETFTLPLDSFVITGRLFGYSFEIDTIEVTAANDTGVLVATKLWSAPPIAGGNLGTFEGYVTNLRDSAVVGAVIDVYIDGAVRDTCDTTGVFSFIYRTESSATGYWSMPMKYTDCLVNTSGKNPLYKIRATYIDDAGTTTVRETSVALPSDSTSVRVTF